MCVHKNRIDGLVILILMELSELLSNVAEKVEFKIRLTVKTSHNCTMKPTRQPNKSVLPYNYINFKLLFTNVAHLI